jgi:hypothetical protein
MSWKPSVFGLDAFFAKDNGNLRVEPAEIHPGGEARVPLDVKNIGDRAGVETVQLCIHEQYGPGFNPRQATPGV